MSLPAILYSLSLIPLFASRPFLTAFLTALVARFGTELPWIGDNPVVLALHASPAWFQSTTALVVLGALAVAEVASASSTEVRQVLDRVDGIVKGAVAFGVVFALLDADTARAVGAIQGASLLGSTWAMTIGGATWGAALLRRGVVELVSDLDDGDDLGLQTLLAWAENSAAVLGVLFVLVFPLVALILAGLTVAAVAGLRRLAEQREQRSKVPCAACGAAVFPHASACGACGRALEAPRAVGVFGQPKAEADARGEGHALELVSRKRCPSCATRLRLRALAQGCPGCRRVTFGSAVEFERYLDHIRARLPRTLFLTFALGLVPVLGVIPAVVLYRLNLVAGLRGYLPPLRGFTTRWIVRVIHVLAVALQPIPLVGALLMPLLCWSSYAIYRRSLTGRAALDLRAAPAAS